MGFGSPPFHGWNRDPIPSINRPDEAISNVFLEPHHFTIQFIFLYITTNSFISKEVLSPI